MIDDDVKENLNEILTIPKGLGDTSEVNNAINN